MRDFPTLQGWLYDSSRRSHRHLGRAARTRSAAAGGLTVSSPTPATLRPLLAFFPNYHRSSQAGLSSRICSCCRCRGHGPPPLMNVRAHRRRARCGRFEWSLLDMEQRRLDSTRARLQAWKAVDRPCHRHALTKPHPRRVASDPCVAGRTRGSAPTCVGVPLAIASSPFRATRRCCQPHDQSSFISASVPTSSGPRGCFRHVGPRRAPRPG